MNIYQLRQKYGYKIVKTTSPFSRTAFIYEAYSQTFLIARAKTLPVLQRRIEWFNKTGQVIK